MIILPGKQLERELNNLRELARSVDDIRLKAVLASMARTLTTNRAIESNDWSRASELTGNCIKLRLLLSRLKRSLGKQQRERLR